MKRTAISLALFSGLLFALPVSAQYASDIFRYSEIVQTGSARFRALGGNHASLGGDPSAISGNPAGLGFYNKSEFTISPSFSGVNTNTNYLGQSSSFTTGKGGIGQASLVITSQPGFQRKWKRTSLGISYSSQQSFKSGFRYRGLNNRSAYVDKIVEDADYVGWTNKRYEDEYFNNGQNYYFLDEAYFGLGMIYPQQYDANGIGGAPYTRDDRNSPTRQDGTFDSKGSLSQWTIAYGGNYDDKLYVGGSLGFTGIKYSFFHSLQDTYVNGTVFRGSTLEEDFEVRGNGINATFGVIYKANPFVQFGGSLSTPTFAKITKEVLSQNVFSDYISGSLPAGEAPTEFNAVLVPNEFQYSMVGPFRGSGGATFFFGQNGFITGTIEYVGYPGMRANSTYYQNTGDNDDFKNNTNADIKALYKGAVNARLGGEYRFGMFRARLGLAYLPDPSKDKSDGINRDKFLYSAGLGVRGNRFFADVSGTMSSFKSTFTPYYLNNPADYSSALITNKVTNVTLTFGVLF